MTWSLSAGGHTQPPEGAENWAEVEQELHDRLQEVLSDPKYGATSSHFGGNYVTGSPHVAKIAHEHASHGDAPAEDAE